MKTRSLLLSVGLFASVGCSKPPPVCDAGTRYYDALKTCVPACEDALGYENCYGRDGELFTDGSYDGPRGDGATDALSATDASDANAEAATMSCDGGQSACMGRCVSTQSDPLNCGACGRTCTAGSGATATCEMGSCASACRSGFERVGADCEPLVPRPVFPSVTSTVTSRRPTLRWALPSGVTGAQVELCRDRACTMMIERVDADGSSARPTADLPANRVVFWRLRGRVDATTGTRQSPTWQFRTGVLSASADTAHGVEADFNGDGYSDLAVSNPAVFPALTEVRYGSSAGIATTAARTFTSATFAGCETVAALGDVNGDGFADLAMACPQRTVATTQYAGVVEVFFGAASGIAATPAQTLRQEATSVLYGSVVVGLGDVNADGYADAAIGRVRTDVGARVSAVGVHLGTPTGLSAMPSQEFEGGVTGGMFNVEVTAIGDGNGDQRSDIALTNLQGDDTTRTFAGSVLGVSTTSSASLGSSNIVCGGADVNGDGLADLALVRDGEASVFLGTPDLRWSSRVPVGATSASVLSRAGALGGDIDSDGYADLVLPVGVGAQQQLVVFTGSPGGLRPQTTTFANADGVALVRAKGDFNSDGFADVVSSSNNSITVWYGAANAVPTMMSAAGSGSSATP